MKLLILEYYEVMRRGLWAVLKEGMGERAIIEASNIEEALRQLSIQKIDVAIISLSMGQKEEAIEIIERAKKMNIETKFLLFTNRIRKEDLDKARRLGIDGYIYKRSSKEEICYAINSVIEGSTYYKIDKLTLSDQEPYSKVQEVFTERECEVLKLIGKGKSNGQIADLLFITEGTVKKHISNILAKLNLSNRTEVALYAIRIWRRKEDWH